MSKRKVQRLINQLAEYLKYEPEGLFLLGEIEAEIFGKGEAA